MNKIKVALIIVMLFSVMFFAGCNEQDENSIEAKKFVGIWINSDDTASYVFYSKGTFRFKSDYGEIYDGTYKVKNELLWFNYTYPSDIEGLVESFNYSFYNDDKTFTISPFEHPENSATFYKQ